MRFMLRRSPCIILAIAELTAIFAFTVMVMALIYMMRLTRDQAKYIHDGITLKERLRDRINLWNCEYMLPPSNLSEFHRITCHATVGVDAVSVAVQQAVTPEKCADILYEVQCHTHVEQERIKRKNKKLRITPKSCAGLYGAPMPYELITSEHVVLAPRLQNEDLKYFMGQLVFASELLVKCPRCKVVTKYYSDSEDNDNANQICRRQLETIRHGWPNSAEYCDEEEFSVANLQKNVYC